MPGNAIISQAFQKAALFFEVRLNSCMQRTTCTQSQYTEVKWMKNQNNNLQVEIMTD